MRRGSKMSVQLSVETEVSESVQANLYSRLSTKLNSNIGIAHDGKYCAVLIPVVVQDSEPHFIFTVRHHSISAHADEVCFPGGFVEQMDQTVVDTAARECREEIGLERENLDVFLVEGPYRLKRRGDPIVLYSVCAIVRNSFVATLNPDEVQDVFTAPLKDFVAPNHLHVMDGVEYSSVFCTGSRNRETYVVWGLSLFLAYRIAASYFGEGSVKNYSELFLSDRTAQSRL